MGLCGLRRYSAVRFLVSYADPAVAPGGVPPPRVSSIRPATASARAGPVRPLFDLGDGRPVDTRSNWSAWGTHSRDYFARNGRHVCEVPTVAKPGYLTFVHPPWRLRVPVLPCPKTGGAVRVEMLEVAVDVLRAAP